MSVASVYKLTLESVSDNWELNLEYFLCSNAADDGLYWTDLTSGTWSKLTDETDLQRVDVMAQLGPQLPSDLHETFNVRLHSQWSHTRSQSLSCKRPWSQHWQSGKGLPEKTATLHHECCDTQSLQPIAMTIAAVVPLYLFIIIIIIINEKINATFSPKTARTSNTHTQKTTCSVKTRGSAAPSVRGHKQVRLQINVVWKLTVLVSTCYVSRVLSILYILYFSWV